LSVRQTEDLVARFQTRSQSPAAERPSRRTTLESDAHLSELQNQLQQRLGTKVQLRYRHGKGTVQIQFFNDDDLHRILQILGVNLD
jgi:ParB family chromosome partitioning protein